MLRDLRKTLTDAIAKDAIASSDFDLNPDVKLPKGRELRHASVLLAIDEQKQSLILTKRSTNLKHHPGQIAFPGGKMDESDKDLTATALREAKEEIALPSANVDVLGTLSGHETVTGFLVTPVVGIVSGEAALKAETGEVEEIFNVPVAHVLNPANFAVQSRRWQGQRRYFQTVPIGPYYIWGATARILWGLAQRVKE